jgi:diguanylate cyclase (GGDEF)-like protein/PAS domain S-box-containing protein
VPSGAELSGFVSNDRLDAFSIDQLVDIFSHLQVLVAYMDRDFNFLRVNHAYAAADGRAPGEFIGKNHFALYPDEDNEALFRRVVETGEPYTAYGRAFSYPARPEQGSRYWDWTLHPLRGEDGSGKGLLLTLVDVTEHHRLERLEALWDEVNGMVLHGEGRQELLQLICSRIAELFDFPLAWIGRRERDGTVSQRACGGISPSCRAALNRMGVRWYGGRDSVGPTGAAIRCGEIQTVRFEGTTASPLAELGREFGIRSAAAVPLVNRGEIYGAFTVYSRVPDLFDVPAMRHRLAAIADHLSVAVEAALDQEWLRLAQSALESAGNAIFITDRGGRIEWVNESFCKLTGYQRHEVIGESPRLLKSGHQAAGYYQTLWKTILDGSAWSDETVERHRDGSLFTVRQTITPIRGAAGEVTHFIAILEDITAQKETAVRLQHMAYHDRLTGLPNRSLFFDRLSLALAMAQRERRSLTVLFIDLDGFKAVNDTLGHQMGDQLLVEVARRLRATVRRSDSVARLAGDEFVAILHSVTCAEGGPVVARKILEALQPPVELDGSVVSVGASIGIACFPCHAESEDELVRLADDAMYAAKRAGRNRYAFTARNSALLPAACGRCVSPETHHAANGES